MEPLPYIVRQDPDTGRWLVIDTSTGVVIDTYHKEKTAKRRATYLSGIRAGSVVPADREASRTSATRPVRI